MGLFKKKKQDEYEHFYGNNQESDVEIVEPEYGEIYDEVYDEQGSFVPCDYSGTPHTYKAFFWNNLEDLIPLCNNAEGLVL